MEGLLLAAALEPLRERLPAEHLGWRFVDAATLVLPLAGSGSLWLDLRPPSPRFALVDSAIKAQASPLNRFQSQLDARSGGPLERVEQAALDRRFTLVFGPSAGFVPTPPVHLEVELTGRHANAALCDDEGRILGVLREIGPALNRHRQLLPGLRYRPPPPYQKLDPRSASREQLAEALSGQRMDRVHARVDGVGRELTRAWASLAGLTPDAVLEADTLPRALVALEELVADPVAALAGGALARDPVSERRHSELQRARDAARARLEDRRELLRARLRDAERAAAAGQDAARLRAEGDLLLAHAHQVARGSGEVTLLGFDGESVRLALSPELDAAGNARLRYERARKREERAERARSHRSEVESELARVETDLERVDDLDEAGLAALAPVSGGPRAGRDRRREPPGLRVRDPRGFEVVIGRSARENDAVTFKVARSDDVWLHAQGYHGAHVVIRAEGREVPFDTVLFAAELAAGHSEAGQSENVAVDYASRKDVWRRKGMPAGAVQYARQRTVFVNPRRRSEVP